MKDINEIIIDLVSIIMAISLTLLFWNMWGGVG